MNRCKNFANASVVALAVFLVPAVSQSNPEIAAIQFFSEDDSSAPMNILDQGETVIQMMSDAQVDGQAVASIEAFQDFVKQNKDLVEKPISQLSPSELLRLQAGYQNALSGMEAIKPIAEALASRDWVMAADPTLAARLKERCGRTFVSGRDVVKEFSEVFNDPTGYSGDTVNIIEDFTGIHRECAEAAADYAALAAQESARLAAYIQEQERLLQEAIDAEDQEAIDRHTANLEEAREDKKKVDRDFNWSQFLKLLAGLGQAVAGVVGIISSAGTCVPCYAAVAKGVYDGYTAVDAMTGSDTVTERTPASRPGIDPSQAPSGEEFTDALEEIELDPRYKVVTPEMPGGNFIVSIEEESGDLVIHQIKPDQVIIPLSLKMASAGIGSANDLLPISRLGEVEWQTVQGTEGISQTQVNLTMTGNIDGQNVVVSFNENPVGRPLVVTVSRN